MKHRAKPLLSDYYSLTIVLMRGTRNVAICKVPRLDFEKENTIYWDEFPDKRKSVFKYSHTTKRGKVFREQKQNITSMVLI